MLRLIFLFPVIFCFIFLSPSLAGAKWSLTPRVYVEGWYDDNIFLTERNEQTDFITTVSPGINLQYLTPTAEVNLDYEYQRFWYNDFPELDYPGHRGRAVARKDFWPWFSAGISETFIRSEDPIEFTGIPEFERPSVKTGRRNRYTRNIVEPEATFRFGENRSIRLGYRNHILRNKEEDVADITENAANALLSFRFNIHNGVEVFYEHINYEYGETFPPKLNRDFDGNEARGRYTYYFDPRTSAFVDYRFYHRNFERETVFFPDYVVHDPRLGFSRDLYENVTLTASAGYAVRDAEDKKKEGTFSGRGDLSATYKRLTVSLLGEAGFDEDFLSAETFGLYEFWRGGFNGRYQLLERLWAEGYFFIERDRYVDLGRADRYINVRGLLGYQPLKWFFLSVEYVYNNRDSNRAFESYRDNRYFGRITFKYDIAERFQ